MDDGKSNYYSGPHNVDPRMSTDEYQRRELPYWAPTDPASSTPQPVTPWQGPVIGGGTVPPRELPGILKRFVGGDFLINVVVLALLWEVWICLYPLSAFAGLQTLLWSMPLLRNVLPPSPIFASGLYAVAGAFVLAAIVLWTASRLEHVLARHVWYRLPRHIVRLALLGFATTLAIQKYQGLRYNPSPAALAYILRNPVNLGVVFAAIVAAHFILWNWRWPRDFWHARLEAARLRKRPA